MVLQNVILESPGTANARSCANLHRHSDGVFSIFQEMYSLVVMDHLRALTENQRSGFFCLVGSWSNAPSQLILATNSIPAL